MRNYLAIALLLFFTVPGPLWGASGNTEAITMRIPQAVLADTIEKSLPVQLSQPSETVQGTISIDQIDSLRLQNQELSAHFLLNGSDMKINTAIGGHQIALKVGTVQLDFNLSAVIRFDEASQTLFIVPQISEMAPDTDQKSSEIGGLLASIFNGREIPVVIDKLQPIITNTGSKQLAINMHIRDIALEPGALVFYLLPDITATAASK